MGIYHRHILPRVTHFLCGLKPAMQQREKVVPQATGRVLEIGIGTVKSRVHYAKVALHEKLESMKNERS